MKASGKFEIGFKRLEAYSGSSDESPLGRMSINKTYSGDLEASSRGEMLTAKTSVPSSAGYVAIEQVSGVLSGKTGSFLLQHFGIMSGGENTLTLEVVPDSAAGELKGLRGKMSIRMVESQHFYDFVYSVP